MLLKYPSSSKYLLGLYSGWEYVNMIEIGKIYLRKQMHAFEVFEKTISISEQIEYVNDYAFYQCKELESVKLHPYSFAFCNAMRFRKIQKYSFSGCLSLPEITFPDSSEIMVESAFSSTNFTLIKFDDDYNDYNIVTFRPIFGIWNNRHYSKLAVIPKYGLIPNSLYLHKVTFIPIIFYSIKLQFLKTFCSSLSEIIFSEFYIFIFAVT